MLVYASCHYHQDGLWMGFDTSVNASYNDHQEWVTGGDLKHFQDNVKLYNNVGGDDPHGTCLSCKSMHLIMTI